MSQTKYPRAMRPLNTIGALAMALFLFVGPDRPEYGGATNSDFVAGHIALCFLAYFAAVSWFPRKDRRGLAAFVICGWTVAVGVLFNPLTWVHVGLGTVALTAMILGLRFMTPPKMNLEIYARCVDRNDTRTLMRVLGTPIYGAAHAHMIKTMGFVTLSSTGVTFYPEKVSVEYQFDKDTRKTVDIPITELLEA